MFLVYWKDHQGKVIPFSIFKSREMANKDRDYINRQGYLHIEAKVCNLQRVKKNDELLQAAVVARLDYAGNDREEYEKYDEYEDPRLSRMDRSDNRIQKLVWEFYSQVSVLQLYLEKVSGAAGRLAGVENERGLFTDKEDYQEVMDSWEG